MLASLHSDLLGLIVHCFSPSTLACLRRTCKALRDKVNRQWERTKNTLPLSAREKALHVRDEFWKKREGSITFLWNNSDFLIIQVSQHKRIYLATSLVCGLQPSMFRGADRKAVLDSLVTHLITSDALIQRFLPIQEEIHILGKRGIYAEEAAFITARTVNRELKSRYQLSLRQMLAVTDPTDQFFILPYILSRLNGRYAMRRDDYKKTAESLVQELAILYAG